MEQKYYRCLVILSVTSNQKHQSEIYLGYLSAFYILKAGHVYMRPHKLI
jgi:hypothetical protein